MSRGVQTNDSMAIGTNESWMKVFRAGQVSCMGTCLDVELITVLGGGS